MLAGVLCRVRDFGGIIKPALLTRNNWIGPAAFFHDEIVNSLPHCCLLKQPGPNAIPEGGLAARRRQTMHLSAASA